MRHATLRSQVGLSTSVANVPQDATDGRETWALAARKPDVGATTPAAATSMERIPNDLTIQ